MGPDGGAGTSLPLVASTAGLLAGVLAPLRRTARAEAACRRAEAADAAKTEFLVRMSHELRTPLNAILGFGQLLEMNEPDPDRRESVRQILEAGRHLLALVNEVLDIQSIETGRFAVSVEPVRVGEIVGETLFMTRPLAAAAGVRMRDESGTCGDVHVRADRRRLKQVLLNLLANAIKYNRRDGLVAVGCELDGEHLRLTVADTGIGIAKADVDRLFLPFERLGAEATRIEGTGLGLALSRRLVEAMGGEIDVRSEVGRGTVICVRLPVTGAPAACPAAPAGAPAPAQASGPAQSVLYIEDNPSNVTLVETILARRPEVTLRAATRGALGLDLALEHRPGLILLDLDLPDMPGEEVLRRLRADDRTRHARVVVVSADAGAHLARRVRDLGADDYLGKPYDVPALLAVVDDAGRAVVTERHPVSVDVPVLDHAFLADLAELHGSAGDSDGRLAEFVAVFIADGEQRLRDLREAVTGDDRETQRRILHALVGTAGAIGASRLLLAARQLEGHVPRGPADGESLLRRVESAFAETKAALTYAFPTEGSRDGIAGGTRSG